MGDTFFYGSYYKIVKSFKIRLKINYSWLYFVNKVKIHDINTVQI